MAIRKEFDPSNGHWRAVDGRYWVIGVTLAIALLFMRAASTAHAANGAPVQAAACYITQSDDGTRVTVHYLDTGDRGGIGVLYTMRSDNRSQVGGWINPSENGVSSLTVYSASGFARVLGIAPTSTVVCGIGYVY